jgi:hypothetical protein
LSDFTAPAPSDAETTAGAGDDRRARSFGRDDLSAVNLLLAALAIACIVAALAGSLTN